MGQRRDKKVKLMDRDNHEMLDSTKKLNTKIDYELIVDYHNSNVGLQPLKYWICSHRIIIYNHMLERILRYLRLWCQRNKTDLAEVATFIRQEHEIFGQCHGLT